MASPGQSAVVCGALPGIATAERVKRPYDLVLVDPPYDHPEIGVILSSVAGLLEPTGVLVLRACPTRGGADG